MLDDDARMDVLRAAALAGKDPTEWLRAAIRSQAQLEASVRKAREALAPGPWPGWRTRTDEGFGYVTHYGPHGEEMFFMPRGWANRPAWWPGPSSRPWSVRTAEDTLLKDKVGRVRTFATADAAKAALDSC